MKKLIPLLLISTAAYAGSPLEGKWADRRNNASIEFLSGGIFVLNSPNDSTPGKWEGLPDNRFLLKGEGFGAGSTICRYSISGNVIDISDCPLAVRLERVR